MELKPELAKRREWERAYRERNRERLRVRGRAYVERNRERINRLSRERMRGVAEKIRPVKRAWHLKATLGITTEDYEEMFTRQGGVCAICHRPETKKRAGRVKYLAVDHDHTSGVIRALLCQTCNQMIGFADDNPKLLEAAALYIRTKRNPQRELKLA